MPQMSPMNWIMLMLYFFIIIIFSMVILSYKDYYYIEKGEFNKITCKEFKMKW